MSRRFTTLMLAAGLTLLSSQAFATKNVTFQVDMGVYMQLNLFHPATDTVIVRGNWQAMAGDTNGNWAGLQWIMTPSNTNDSVYTVTVPFPDSAANAPQDTIQYKYVIHNTSGDNWESSPNRVYVITSASNQQVPLAYFADVASAGVSANVTFNANMSFLLDEGFNPSKDSIGVRGDTPGLQWSWVTANDLSPVFGNPTTYSVTIPITATPGHTVEWKFFAGGQDLFTNGGWENSIKGVGWDSVSGNRMFTFAGNDTTLDIDSVLISLTAATATADTVTFSLDMSSAVERYHNTAITGLTHVYMKGSDAPLTWGGVWTLADTAAPSTMVALQDSGNGIWWTQLIFPAQSVQTLSYKYGALFSGADTLNGAVDYLDNEAGYGENHNVNLVGTHQYFHNKFGDQVTAVRENPNGVKLPTTYQISQNYPNPFNPTTQINYSVPKNSYVTLKVYNVLGQEVATVFAGNQKAGNYIATFDGNRLASGVYFYRLQAGSFSSVKKMVLMK